MACRSRSRSPVDANFTHSVDYTHLDGEIDIEFPMSTDVDIDCIVQDISDSGGASLGSVEKPSAIDAIQKHVEESLLFLDEEKSTLQKTDNTTGDLHQKINIVLEKPESDDTVMKDVDESLRHIEMNANDKNTGEPLKNTTVILKLDNKNDALLSDEQQKDKIEDESVTTENKVDSLLDVNEEISNIPEIMETNDDILSLEDNTISDSVLNDDKAMNNAQEETSFISEQTDTVKFVPPSNSAVNELDTDTTFNVSLEQKSDIPVTDSNKANIVSQEHRTTSDSVLNKMNKDTVTDNPQKVTRDMTEQIDISKVIVSQEHNLSSDSTVHETDTHTVANVSRGQKSVFPLLTDGKNANIFSLEDTSTSDTALNEINTDVMNNDSKNNPSELSRQSDGNKVPIALQEDNPSSLSTLNETDTDSSIYDSDLKSSDISEQSAAIKASNALDEDNPSSENMLNETDTNAEIVNIQEKTSDNSIVLHEGISRSDSLLDATDADVTMNYDSQEELGDNSKQIITNEISNLSKEQKSPSYSILNKTDLDANLDDTQEDISDIPQQNDEIANSNVSQEKNSSSESVLDETGEDASLNGPQVETRDASEQSGINEISNISQEDSIVLNETDTDAAINVSPDILEQIEILKVNNIYQYKVLNETDTDVTINDSQEEMSDISELVDSKEVSMVSQENLPSDIVCNTDIDATINDSQEEIIDMNTYSIDDSNISEKGNSELDKTDAAVNKGCETDNKTIETSANCQDYPKSIKKEGHEKSATEPQKDRIEEVEVESKEMNCQTDELRQVIENTTTDNEENNKFPQLESNEEKTGLSENETQVKKEVNITGLTNQKSPVKELVWEIKSIKTETEQQGKKELLQKERTQEQNVTEYPTEKNPLVRAAPLKDVTECPPAKRSRFQPVWTTNPLNDEDKPKAEQGTWSDKTGKGVNTDNDATAEVAPENPYLISQEAKKHLKTWLLQSGLAHPRAKYMLKLANDARWNKAVLRMAPIPKDYKLMDVFKIVRDQTASYDRDISKNIQYIHIDKHDDNFNAAYIKWRDIDKLLVVKAYQILVTTSFTVDGVVKEPLFKYDDRSIIDWNEKERPILDLKDVNVVNPQNVSTPALSPVVTPIATDAATTSATPVAKLEAVTVAKPAETPVPKPRKPPPAPFITGKINYKDRQAFGLSSEFLEYLNIKPPIVCFIFAKNLDKSQPIERYHRIFTAAGDIVDMEVMPPAHQDEQQSLKLRIGYNHGLEAVQAYSMFHEQVLYGRLIEVEMGHISMKKKQLLIEGCSAVGPGLGSNGFIMRDIRLNIELSKLRARTKVQLDNFKGQITALRQKLTTATFKLEQVKRDEEKRRFKEEKQIQSRNESQNKQANMDAVSAITKAIASSVQANVITMLGIQSNQQQNVKQAPATVNNEPSGIQQNQNTPRAPSNWTVNENAVTTLPNTAIELPNTATSLQNPNMVGQTSMENAFHNFELQTYQNPQNPYSYYASMQQAYAQYGYNMDPTLMQAHAYIQPGTSYMQPAIGNVQPVPPVKTSNMPSTTPKTQSMPTIISNQHGPSKPSTPTQSNVHTESKTVLPPLPTTNKNDYEIQKPPLRFNKPPANVGIKNTAPSRFDVPPAMMRQTPAAQCKVPVPLPISTISQPAVKMAFKVQKPIVPPKETKSAGIHIKIPSMLPETVPLVIQNPRTVEKNNVHKKLIKLAGKLPGEPWINKQIREMRKNSKSPEKIRKSPEKIKSPDLIQKTLPKVILPPRGVKRWSRSPERRRTSRSPIRRRSRSNERRRMSRSPKRRTSRSPIRRRSRSPIRRRSRSTERRRFSRSPIRRRSRSTERRRKSRSPKRRMSRSPKRRTSRSPMRRKSRSPARRISRSPKRGLSRSPVRRKSKSPIRRRSRSPKRRISRSPVERISKSPVRVTMPSSERKGVSRSRSTELGPKPTPRPAYEPDGASRDITNLDHKDSSYNFNRESEKDLTNTAVNFSFLPPSVATEDLIDKMGEIGELLKVRAFGMGKALVVFKFRQDAETCIEMYNMAKVDGQTIEVIWASIDDMLDKEEKILVFNSSLYSAIVV